MKKIILIRLNLAFLFYFFSNVSFAQKIESTPIIGAGRVVMYTNFEGIIVNKEIRSNVRAAGIKYNYNLLVYENGKKLSKKDIEIQYNETKYVPVGYFIKESKIVAYFIAGTKNSEQVKLCLQEFDSELKQIGQPIEIIELPKAVDPSKLLDSKSGGMFSDKLVKEQDLKIKYDKTNGTILFCFSLQLVKEQNVSYCKIILLDDNYKVLNNYDYHAASGENYIQATPQQIFENNDAMVSIAEGIKEMEKNSITETFKISKQAQIYVSAIGIPAKELELMPDQPQIININTSDNLTKEGNVLYGIISTELFEEKKPITTGHINLYTYDVKTEKLERNSYQYTMDDVFKDYYLRNPSSFSLKKVHSLPDGSVLLWLSASSSTQDFANIFLKIDKNKQISWIKGFRKESINSILGLAGAFDFIDQNGNFNLIFNFPLKKFKENNLKTCFGNGPGIMYTPNTTKLDLGSVPIIATLNISNGDITMKNMSIENSVVGAVVISDCEKLNSEGKYRMHMMINKKLQFVEIDFNAN